MNALCGQRSLLVPCGPDMSSRPSSTALNVVGKLEELFKNRRPLPTIRSPPTDSEQLLKCTLEVNEILRAEHTAKHCLAMEAVDKCLQLLMDERRNQLSDLEKCNNEKDALLASVREMSNKFHAVQSKQNDLSARVVSILQHLKNIQPPLSQDELRMKAALEKMQQNCVHYSSSLKELQARQQFQENALSSEWIRNGNTQGNTSQEDDSRLSPDELRKMELVLQKQTSSTLKLMDRVNHLKQLIAD